MSHDTASPPAAAPPPAKTGSMIRLGILIALLLVAIGMWYYDYSYAGPRSTQAHDDIEKLVSQRNEQSVKSKDGGVVRREEIKDLLKFGPTYTKKEQDYDVEYYCWWGPIPGLNTWKRYITVVYVGPEPRRYQTHHLNEAPPEELLPGYEPPASGEPGDMSSAAPPPGEGGSPPSGGTGAEGGKKGKGGRGRGSAPAEGDAPTTENPGDVKPATEGDKPATEGDKPATEGDKPADAPKEGDAEKPAAAETDEKPAAEASEPKPQ